MPSQQEPGKILISYTPPLQIDIMTLICQSNPIKLVSTSSIDQAGKIYFGLSSCNNCSYIGVEAPPCVAEKAVARSQFSSSLEMQSIKQKIRSSISVRDVRLFCLSYCQYISYGYWLKVMHMVDKFAAGTVGVHDSAWRPDWDVLDDL